MNVAILRDRLRQLAESLKQTQQLIKRLSKLPATTEPSTNAPAEDVFADLTNEIHESLREQEDEFELIQQEAEDLTSPSPWARRKESRQESAREQEKADLASFVIRLGEDLKTAHVQFRKAQLQAKRDAEAIQRKERELLFTQLLEGPEEEPDENFTGDSSSIAPSAVVPRRGRGQQEKLSQDEQLLGASNDVTEALRRTHALMTSELERSQFARETLENSTKELSHLTERYSNLDSLLSSSRNLVSTLISSRKSDTWYLETTLYILIATIAWLVFRRILYGPGWWLIYFPLRSLWWLLSTLVLGPVLALFGAKAPGELVQNSSLTSSEFSHPVNKLGIPTFPANMPAPSVGVGGGAKDGNLHGGDHSRDGPASDNLAEQVGQMAEKSRAETREGKQPGDDSDASVAAANPGEGEGTVLRERTTEDGPANPKKRMWEEPLNDDKQPRDEL